VEELLGKNDDESQWLPISDLMSVLMMVFLLIAVSYMLRVNSEKEKIQEIAVTYNKLQDDLYEALNTEFKSDLKKWNAEIDKSSLSIRFKSPEILFDRGIADIKEEFKVILKDFFPRFVNILYSNKYKEDIEEIRIEGHTSSIWNATVGKDMAYIYNMKLSQDRTRNVLDYVLVNEKDEKLLSWIRKYVTANGLSSSKQILKSNGEENTELSRRVEFRVKTNAEKRIAKILLEQ